MASTYDLTQQDFASIKLNDGEPFKIRLLKRKDRPEFTALQRKIEAKQVPDDYDIVEIMKGYVFPEDLERFEEAAGEFTLYQLSRLSDTFFDMNGLTVAQVKEIKEEVEKKAAQE